MGLLVWLLELILSHWLPQINNVKLKTWILKQISYIQTLIMQESVSETLVILRITSQTMKTRHHNGNWIFNEKLTCFLKFRFRFDKKKSASVSRLVYHPISLKLSFWVWRWISTTPDRKKGIIRLIWIYDGSLRSRHQSYGVYFWAQKVYVMNYFPTHSARKALFSNP